MAPIQVKRGDVFRAWHDKSFSGWDEPPREKFCVVFNETPTGPGDEVHYFLATSQVHFFREKPIFLSDVLIIPVGTYNFFSKETAIDFRELWSAPSSKLRKKGYKLMGSLNEEHIVKSIGVARQARLLPNQHKKLLGIL